MFRSAAVSMGALGIFCITAQAAQWDHVHLTVSDSGAALEWYTKHFGGTPTKSGPFDAILFGTNLIKFREAETVGGSAGSPVNHIGFAVADVAAKVEAMEDDGVDVARPVRTIEGTDIVVAHITDPWGTQIELIEDGGERGFHHVHLLSPDPQKTMQWYVDVYGGKLEKFRGLDAVWAIRYNDMWLMATKTDELLDFKTRSIDHLGWNMKTWDDTVANLEEKSTVFQLAPRKSGDHMMAFIEGPHAVKIEIIEDTH